jgi:hypothetical protein
MNPQLTIAGLKSRIAELIKQSDRLLGERDAALASAEAAETEVQRLGQALSDKTSEFLRLKSDLAPVVAALKACDFYLPDAGHPSRSMVKQALALLEKLGVKEEK